MRTEDLLAACLDARAHGRAPAEIIDGSATCEQRAELETLLTLAARLERLAPPSIPRAARAAIATRLAGVTGSRMDPEGTSLPDFASGPDVSRMLADPWLTFLRNGKRTPHLGLIQ